jgi:hypothetical protein
MPTDPIARDVFVAIAVKLAVLIAVALFVFGPKQRPRIDVGAIETRLVGTSPSVAAPGDATP